MSDTVIMGAAVGYRVDQVLPFVHSVRQCGYRGEVVLLTDPALRRALECHARQAYISLVEVDARPPRWRRGSPTGAALRVRGLAWCVLQLAYRLPLSRNRRAMITGWLAEQVYAPTETRYFRYLEIVRRNRYRGVLLTDVRDVLFQHDPFDDLPDAGLAISLETPRNRLSSERFNARWIRRAYGESMLSRIGNHRVSCSGVTYGSGEAMLHYLDLMTREILSLRPARAGEGGIDQAVHNVLVWTQRLGDVESLEPLSSTVATLDGIDAEQVTVRSGRVVNDDESEPSVLHQYDRVPGLAATLQSSLTGS